MTAKEIKKIVLTTGGTGGHVFPAEALANELIAAGIEVIFITDRRGTNFSGNFSGSKIFRIFAGAFAGGSLFSKIKGLFLIALGFWQSILILRRIKPKAVVGFGGYAAFPACYAAGFLKIPLVIHEQNAVLGGANRVLAKHSSLIATNFPHVLRIPKNIPTAYTGVPVRPTLLALNKESYPPVKEPFNILIFGGSQGAKILSRVVPNALKLLPQEFKRKLTVTQQCRGADLPEAQSIYEGSGLNVELAPFFSDMDQRYKKAHLVICRAGASTITELTIVGRPAILIPILRSPDAHQLENAKFVAENGGGFLCEEPNFTPEWLSTKIQELFNDSKLLITAAANVKKLGMPNATELFAQAVLETAREKENQ